MRPSELLIGNARATLVGINRCWNTIHTCSWELETDCVGWEYSTSTCTSMPLALLISGHGSQSEGPTIPTRQTTRCFEFDSQLSS
jgi:hypothetical protein